MDVGGMRIPYKGKNETFTENQLVSKNPFEQFDNWFQLAAKTEHIEESNAMCLSTATKDGRPSSRMVLLKGYGPEGFKFFTNYNSRKAQELNENPYASLNFYWEPLRRCVRVNGRVEKVSPEESTSYFNSRPLSSRISAFVSPQSQPVSNREFLLSKQTELIELSKDHPEKITKPDHWGGFLVIPETIEFWQGQTNRLHDRIRFRRLKSGEVVDNSLLHEGQDGWVFERLGP